MAISWPQHQQHVMHTQREPPCRARRRAWRSRFAKIRRCTASRLVCSGRPLLGKQQPNAHVPPACQQATLTPSDGIARSRWLGQARAPRGSRRARHASNDRGEAGTPRARRDGRGGAARPAIRVVGTYPNRATEVTSVINSIALGVSPGSIVNNSIIYLSWCVLDKNLRCL